MNVDFAYILLYVILIFVSLKYNKCITCGNVQYKTSLQRFALFISFLFIAFRSPEVGADTLNYVGYLTGKYNYYNDDSRDLEWMFVSYREVISALTSSVFIVMIINSILTLYPLWILAKKISPNPPLSCLLFFFMYGPFVYFVGLRQVLGFSLLLVGIILYLNEKNSLLFRRLSLVIFSILGYFFHTSIGIYGLIVFLVSFIDIRYKLPIYAAIIGSALLGFVAGQVFLSDFVSSYLSVDIGAFERLNGYLYGEMDATYTGGVLFVGLASLCSVNLLDIEMLDHILTKMFLMGVIMLNMLYTIPMATRIVAPFLVLGCIVVPLAIYSQNKKGRESFVIAIMLLLISLKPIKDSVAYDKDSLDCLHPYSTIFEY